MHRYSFVNLLRRGSNGRVLVVASRCSGRRYALKEIRLETLSSVERDRALQEVSILSRLRHPYVIRHKEAFLDAGALLIVMEYAEGGDLRAFIRQARANSCPLPEDRILKWAYQMASALAYIHSEGIMHRGMLAICLLLTDLKSQNIFLTRDGDIKLGDFGIARQMDNSAWATTMVGTPYYLSPELCQNRPYNIQSDMWSLGCVLYELCTFRHPFSGASVQSLLRNITEGQCTPIPSHYSPELRTILSTLLALDPAARPTSRDLEHTLGRIINDRVCTAPSPHPHWTPMHNAESDSSAPYNENAPRASEQQPHRDSPAHVSQDPANVDKASSTANGNVMTQLVTELVGSESLVRAKAFVQSLGPMQTSSDQTLHDAILKVMRGILGPTKAQYAALVLQACVGQD